jgi:hypothetical protein
MDERVNISRISWGPLERLITDELIEDYLKTIEK